MRPRDAALYAQLNSAFGTFSEPLPGIAQQANRVALLEQILESVHRVEYVRTLCDLDISGVRKDPNSPLFDPLKAAVLEKRAGNMEEAFWLVFLLVHFGKSLQGGWRYVRDVYGQLGGGCWDWASVSADPTAFRVWLRAHQDEIQGRKPPCRFGNHRKYQSLDADKKSGTGAAVESYVGWTGAARSQQAVMQKALQNSNGDSALAFDALYNSMSVVVSFGRMARFDYLTMVGKLALAPIEPGSAYIAHATGPLNGARLLFGSGRKPSELDCLVTSLGGHLGMGMQVMEDAICNWAKNPNKFVPFRG